MKHLLNHQMWGKRAYTIVFVGPFLRRIVVCDGWEVLLFQDGKFERLLKAGRHYAFGWNVFLQEVDVRECNLIVAGQEVLTGDQLSVKISVVIQYKVTKAELALRAVQNYGEILHLAVQEGIRLAVGNKKLDELLNQREQMIEAMWPLVTAQAEGVGVQVLRLTLRDFMLSAELKQAYANTVKARLEAQATLERTRGEVAALRSLLNATQLMEAHPGLYQLRYLQTVDRAMSEGKGHTVMLGGSTEMPIPMPRK